MSEKFTKGDFGVSQSPVASFRLMIQTSPPDEVSRAMDSGRLPVTVRRIAILESSAYVSLEENMANANLFVAAKDLYLAAKALCDRHDERARAANFERCGCEDCTPFRAALKKAVRE